MLTGQPHPQNAIVCTTQVDGKEIARFMPVATAMPSILSCAQQNHPEVDQTYLPRGQDIHHTWQHQ